MAGAARPNSHVSFHKSLRNAIGSLYSIVHTGTEFDLAMTSVPPQEAKYTFIIAVLVLFLMCSVLWVFGTLPWVIINYFLCTSPDSSVACAYPDTYGYYMRQILATDVIVIICSGFAIAQIRRIRRANNHANS